MLGNIINDAMQHSGVYEFPLTVSYDRPDHLRYLLLCACSFKGIENLLWRALGMRILQCGNCILQFCVITQLIPATRYYDN